MGGHHWIARRVPDDAYVTMPNQLGLDYFDLNDAFGEQREYLCSSDLREFMAENHLDLTMRTGEGTLPEGVFNPREAWIHSDSDHVYNTPRAWAMQRFLSPHAEDWDTPVPLHPSNQYLVPRARAQAHHRGRQVRALAPLPGHPVRPLRQAGRRGHAPASTAPVGINRNGQLSAVQLRPDVPEAVRAVQWIAYGSNPFNALVPLYANVDEAPEYFANTEARVSTESFYWGEPPDRGPGRRPLRRLPARHRALPAQGRRRRPPRDRADRPQGARGRGSATTPPPRCSPRPTPRWRPSCASRPTTC